MKFIKILIAFVFLPNGYFQSKGYLSDAIDSLSKPDDRSIEITNRTYQAVFREDKIIFHPNGDAPEWVWSFDGSAGVKPEHGQGKIVYHRSQFREEYILKEQTVEQQFIVQEFVDEGSLVIKGKIQCNGLFSKEDQKWTWRNRYGTVSLSDVYAFDANGKEVQAEMEVNKTSTVIEIKKEALLAATFPITIDPELSTDFRISTFGPNGSTAYLATNSSIAYSASADKYLAVWSGSINGEYEIYGQFMNGYTGLPTGSQITISNMGPLGNTAYAALQPDVATSGSEFLVVWSADDNSGSLVDDEFEIYGQRIDASSGSLVGSRVRISDMGPDGDANFDATAPSVVYNATNLEYLVAWQGDDNTGSLVNDEYEIYVQRLSSTADGSSYANDVRISDMGNDGTSTYQAFFPDVAWNSSDNQYVVVWRGDDSLFPLADNEYEIFCQQLTSSATQTGSNDLRISFMGTNGSTAYTADEPSISYNSLNNNYLICWLSDNNSGGVVDDEYEIYGSTFSSTQVIGTMVRISDMGPDGNTSYAALSPTVQHDPYLNQFLVAWQGDDNAATIDNEYEIFGQLMSGTGAEVGSDTRLSSVGGSGNTTYNALSPSMVYNSTYHEFIIAWHGDNNIIGGMADNEYEIWGQRFAETKTEPTAQPTSPNFTLPTSSSFTVNFSASSPVADGYIALRRSGAMVIPSDQTQYTVGSTIGTNPNISSVVHLGSATTFDESALSPGTTYTYDIFSFNGAYSAINYRTTTPLLATATTYSLEPTSHPLLFAASQSGTNKITLSFSAASTITNASGYIILRRQDGTNPTASGISDGVVAPGTPLAGTTLITTITNTSTTSFDDTGLTASTKYNYAIIPYGYNGSNALTYNYRTAVTIPTANATTLSLEPTAHAASFTATPSGTSQINLAFSAASTITNAAGYIILRRQDGTDPSATGVNDGAATSSTPTTGTTLITTITNTATTTYNDAVSPGTQYNYAIIPYGYDGSSALTYNYRTAATIPTANATTLSLEPNAHPAAFSAVTAGSNQIDLSFSAASTITNAAGYIILRREDLTDPSATGIADAAATPSTPTTGTTLVTTITNAATTSFSDPSVSPGIQYNYAIFPFGYNGSNSLTFNYLLSAGLTTNAYTYSLEPTAHAASFTATASGTSQINLSFSAASTITNAAGYIILRRQDTTNPTASGVNDGAATSSTPITGTTLVTTITNTATTTFNDVVSPGTQYNYAIIPYGYDGSSALTYNYRTVATIPTANATTLSLEPSAHPAAFSAATAGSNQIDLSFSAASTITNAAGYIILRREDLTNPSATGIADAAATPSTPTTGTTLVTTITNTATTSFSDPSVSPGIQYNYAIFPFDYNGSNSLTFNYLLSAGLTTNAYTYSLEPTAHAASFTATASGTSQINLSFSAASAITNTAGYIILRRQDATNPTASGVNDGAATSSTPITGTTLVTTITNTATTTFNDAVSSGTQYNYAIVPYGYNNSSVLSYNYRTVTTIPTANATTLSLEPESYPSVFTATQSGTSQIDLTFSPASSIANANGYIILRRSDGINPNASGIQDGATVSGSPATGTTLLTTITNDAIGSFSDTGLSSGVQYNYAVIPYGYNGSSALTYNYRTATPIPAVNTSTLPIAPVALDADPIGVNSFTAKWQSVVGAISYEIDISLNNNFDSHVPTYPQDVGNTLEWGVTSLTSNTLYYYKVRAINGSGASQYSNVKPVQTTTGGSELNLGTISFSDLPVGQSSVNISVNISGGTGTKTVQLHHRNISSADAYSVLPMVNTTGDTYSVDLSETKFDELGVEFFIRASDASPNPSKNSTLKYCYRSFLAQTAPQISLPTGFNGKTSSYQMFSIPYVLDDKNFESIFDELGAYNKENWRLFHYDNSSGSYKEYKSGLATNIELGNGYWFIAASDPTESIQVGAGKGFTATQAGPFSMSFKPGWNQIGNPYPFNIDWSIVQSANPAVGLNSLHVWEKGGYKSPAPTVLAVWKGAFVYADNGGTVTFPVTSRTNSSGRTGSGELSIDIDSDSWKLPVTLSFQDFTQTSSVGMHPLASLSKDKFDDITVPRFIDYLEMHTLHPEFKTHKFSDDVVPTDGNFSWQFNLASNLSGGNATLSWNNEALQKSESQIMLIDLTDQFWIDMKKVGTYSFAWKNDRQIKIAFACHGDIDPDVTLLGQAYPNPFADKVSIPVLVGTHSPGVQVDVFDMMGRKVKSFPANFSSPGAHEIIWDGKDNAGNDVGNGALIYRLSNSSQSKRIIKQ